jgi:hypothetical protein
VIPRAVLVPVLGLLLSLVVAGCRTSGSAPLETQLRGVRLSDDDARAERVLRRYLEISDSRKALRGSARVALEGPDFKLNRPQRILVERPARLRFEIIGLFDQIAAMLAVDGGQYGFYDAAASRVSRGRVTPSLLWELAKIDLEVYELVELLLGAPRPSRGLARASAWLEPSGRMALVFASPRNEIPRACRDSPDGGFFDPICFASGDALEEGGELFYFDPAGRLVEMRSLASRGRIRFRATFEGYQTLPGDDSDLEFPERTTIHSPGSGTKSMARFVWKRVMLAEELSDRFFQIRRRSKSTPGG